MLFRSALLILIPVTLFHANALPAATDRPAKAPKAKASKATPKPTPEITVAIRLAQYGERARKRIKPYFQRQRVVYPPKQVVLVALKKERLLKVYAPDSTGDWRFVCQYPVAAASGTCGPKLRQGDMQVPEGIYRVDFLNPTSLFHLSLGLNYPNEFDRKHAKRDGRDKLGNEIMIHGSWFSEGCLALGDTAAEDIFVLTADTGSQHVRVIISPLDFRTSSLDEDSITTATHPAWTKTLYKDLKRALTELEDGTSTQAQLIAYADSRPPAPVEKADAMTELIGLFVEAMAEVAEESLTSSTK